MIVTTTDHPPEEAPQKKDWGILLFLTFTPIIGFVGTGLYTWKQGFSLWMPMLAVAMYALVGLSICAGYHRFFSHKSYECAPIVQVFYAIFGAMAAQNSILWWSASHRVHHKYVDRDWDPYSIQRGFWWAHILWVFYKHSPPDVTGNAPDLLKNPIVMWQHRWYKVLLILGGFGIPTAIGWMFGDPLAGLLWGGFLRLVVVHHTTFFVNSLAHYVGKPRYNPEISARDNWAVALLTLGEGYHSFHHRFPADFRNGIRWYHWDPAKWFIRALFWTGLASALRSTPTPQVEQALRRGELGLVEARIEATPGTLSEELRRRGSAAQAHLEKAIKLWPQVLEQPATAPSSLSDTHRRTARYHLRESRREWKRLLQLLARATR